MRFRWGAAGGGLNEKWKGEKGKWVTGDGGDNKMKLGGVVSRNK